MNAIHKKPDLPSLISIMVLKIDIDEIRLPISAMLKLRKMELAIILSEYFGFRTQQSSWTSLTKRSNLEEKVDEDKGIVFISSMTPCQ